MFCNTRITLWRRIRRTLVGLFIIIWAVQADGSALARQEPVTAPVTVDVTGVLPTPSPAPTDVAPVPTEVAPTETAIPTMTPPFIPSATATQASTPPSTEIAPTDTPSPASTEAASLSYGIDDQVPCSPVGESIAFELRSQADYRCTLGVDISGSTPEVGSIQASWELMASAGEGWEVQLRLPDQAWGLPSSNPAINAQQQLSSGDNPLHAVQSVEVRLVRTGCQAGTQPVTVTGTISISLPDQNDVKIATPDQTIATGEIAPTLAADPEPELAFLGALDLGEVSADTWQETAQASGAITLQISGLDRTCGSWKIVMSGAVLRSDTGSTIPAVNLWLAHINDLKPEAGACPLDRGCLVGVVSAGPGAAASQDFLLEITLDVPAGTLAGSFASSITASVQAD